MEKERPLDHPEKVMDLYKEICNNIRVSDDISFKLLGIVPVVSGIGATTLTFLEKSKSLSTHTSLAVVSLSLLAALMTFGLFVWELRNIQKCSWFIARAADFELRLLGRTDAKEDHSTILFAGMTNNLKPTKKLSDRPWGKTQGEKIVYSAAIVIWLIPTILVICYR